MNENKTTKALDTKEIALKINKVRIKKPEKYFYLQGWIDCLLQEEITNEKN